VLGGVALGVTLVAVYALATRLFQDRFHTYDDPYTLYRLSAPLGYSNALAVLAAVGLLVALGLMTHARRDLTSWAPAAALPVLATTLYFTFSREAWVALVLAFGIAVALDRSRLPLSSPRASSQHWPCSSRERSRAGCRSRSEFARASTCRLPCWSSR